MRRKRMHWPHIIGRFPQPQPDPGPPSWDSRRKRARLPALAPRNSRGPHHTVLGLASGHVSQEQCFHQPQPALCLCSRGMTTDLGGM